MLVGSYGMDHNFWGNLSLIAVYLCCLVKIKPWIPRHLMHTSHDCHIWSMMISVQWILLFLGVFMNYQYQYNHQSSGDYWYMSVLTSEHIFRCIDISRILKTFRHLGYKTLQAFSSHKQNPSNKWSDLDSAMCAFCLYLPWSHWPDRPSCFQGNIYWAV